MRTSVADEKLREKEFYFHCICYRDQTNNIRHDEIPLKEEVVIEKFTKVTEFAKLDIFVCGRTS